MGQGILGVLLGHSKEFTVPSPKALDICCAIYFLTVIVMLTNSKKLRYNIYININLYKYTLYIYLFLIKILAIKSFEIPLPEDDYKIQYTLKVHPQLSLLTPHCAA